MGRGELMITNGEDWQWVTMTEGEVFHVHALAAHRNVLYAATSAWRAGLQRSTDHGRSWEPIHEHKTPTGRVSRFTGLAVLKNHVYAGLAGPSRKAPKLFALTEPESVRPLTGWPPGRRSSILAVHAGWLYATNRDDTGRRVWRTDGQRSQPVAGLDEYDVRAVAPDGEGLLAVVASGDGGALLRNNGGREWRVIRTQGPRMSWQDNHGGSMFLDDEPGVMPDLQRCFFAILNSAKLVCREFSAREARLMS